MPLILVLRKLKQEDWFEYEANMDYTMIPPYQKFKGKGGEKKEKEKWEKPIDRLLRYTGEPLPTLTHLALGSSP